ncbi:hypothetical protein D3C76_1092710 [compost metagenome]
MLPDGFGVTQALAQVGDLGVLAFVLLADALQQVIESGIEFAFSGGAAVLSAFIALLVGFDVVARGAFVVLGIGAECQQYQGQPYHRSHLRHPPEASRTWAPILAQRRSKEQGSRCTCEKACRLSEHLFTDVS